MHTFLYRGMTKEQAAEETNNRKLITKSVRTVTMQVDENTNSDDSTVKARWKRNEEQAVRPKNNNLTKESCFGRFREKINKLVP